MITQYRPSLKASSSIPETEVDLETTRWGRLRADRTASLRGGDHLKRTLTRMPVDQLLNVTAYGHIYNRSRADRFEGNVVTPADFCYSYSLGRRTGFAAALPFFYTARHAAEGGVVKKGYISLAIPIYERGREELATYAIATTYGSSARICTVLARKTAESNHRRYLSAIEEGVPDIRCN